MWVQSHQVEEGINSNHNNPENYIKKALQAATTLRHFFSFFCCITNHWFVFLKKYLKQTILLCIKLKQHFFPIHSNNYAFIFDAKQKLKIFSQFFLLKTPAFSMQSWWKSFSCSTLCLSSFTSFSPHFDLQLFLACLFLVAPFLCHMMCRTVTIFVNLGVDVILFYSLTERYSYRQRMFEIRWLQADCKCELFFWLAVS